MSRRSPVHAAIARRLAKAAIKNLPITLAFPDGTHLGCRRPASGAGPAGLLLRPARRRRPDRLRRGLDDRRHDHRRLARDRRRARRACPGGYAASTRAGQRGDRRARRRPRRAVPPDVRAGPAARCRRCGMPGRAGRRPPRRTPRPVPGRTSTATTTCRTTCSSCSSIRRMTYSAAWFEPGDDLLTGAEPQDRRHSRPGPGRSPASGCWRSAPDGVGWPSAPCRSGTSTSPR